MRKLLLLAACALLSSVALAQTKPAVLPPWASTAVPTTDIIQPANGFISAGWPLSSTPPSRQYFNWVLNYATNGVRYFSHRGIADWDSAETYGSGDLTLGPDGFLYRSLAGSNTGNTPASSPTWWGSAFAPTPAPTSNDHSIATTAFVQSGFLPRGSAFSALTGTVAPNQLIIADVTQYQGALTIGWNQLINIPEDVNPTAGTLVVRDVGGHINTTYLNQSSLNNEDPNIQQIMVTNGGDNFLRKADLAYFQSQLNLARIGGGVQASQLSNANTPPIGDSSSAIATTAFANPNTSNVANGHAELPGGTIIEWGVVSTSATGGVPVDVVIGFSPPFPHNVFGVYVTTQRSVNSGVGQAVNGSNFSSNYALGSATITIDQTTTGTATAHWMAIGN